MPEESFVLTPEEKIQLISSIKFEDGKESGFEHGSLTGEVEVHRSQGDLTIWIQFPEDLNNHQHMIRAVELYAQLKYNQTIPMDICVVHAYDPRVTTLFQHRTPQWNELSKIYERRPSVW